MKAFLLKILSKEKYEVIDFGNSELNNEDDYPVLVISSVDEIANGTVDLGIAVCGCEVGACVAVNKVAGLSGRLITEKFLA